MHVYNANKKAVYILTRLNGTLQKLALENQTPAMHKNKTCCALYIY